MHAALDALLGGTKRLALDYSPDCEIPNIAFADAGTVEFLRARGYEVVSSADLFQIGAMVWDEAALASHARASAAVAAVKDAAFGFVAEALRAGRRVTEHEVQSFIADALAHRGLEYEGVPVVQVNQHAGAIYYEPPAEGSAVISPGDWLLIDLWAREPGEENVYADIAWVAYAGRDVPTQMQRVFDIVRAARDAVIKALAEAWRLGDTLRGWQLDRVARDLITKHGYGDYFGHRTGHSMGPGKRLHGLGVNLDDFETHDTRRVLPGLGFSVEPGIYLPDFGVRLEVNVHFAPDTGPRVTTPLQTDIVRLL
ncbi:MAG: M24 family metallopeptidase [Pseudomonadota bacterium]